MTPSPTCLQGHGLSLLLELFMLHLSFIWTTHTFFPIWFQEQKQLQWELLRKCFLIKQSSLLSLFISFILLLLLLKTNQLRRVLKIQRTNFCQHYLQIIKYGQQLTCLISIWFLFNIKCYLQTVSPSFSMQFFHTFIIHIK